MSRKPRVVVAVLLAAGMLASCGLEHTSSPPPPHIAPSVPAGGIVQPTRTVPKPVVIPSKTQSGPSDTVVLTKNKLYSVGTMKSTGCHEPKAKPTTSAAVSAFYRSLEQCLNRGWPATVAAAGYKFRAPRQYVWWSSTDSPCGLSSPLVSFYCPADQTIYLSGDEIIQTNGNYGYIGAQWWATHVLPHEYGHHVQELTGIMPAYQHLYAAAPNQAAKDQLTRRLELQASCLGHVFLMANKRSYPITAQMLGDWSWRTIRIPNHGSVAAQRYWISRAVAMKRPGACNTWAAPASQVA
ncbi:neutral zinc metallopeptidase [Kribbella sp. NPDC055071]